VINPLLVDLSETGETHEEWPSTDHQVTQSEERCQVQSDLLDLSTSGVEEFLDVKELYDLLRTEPGSDSVRTEG
jgi:hypothetical protein